MYFNKNRDIILVKKRGARMQKKKFIYRTIDILSIILMIATFVLLVLFWKKIPDTIPSHYDGAGMPDAYNDKSSLILLVFAEVFTLGSMLFAKLMVKMTSSSNNSIMETINPMLSVLNFGLVVMFTYMFYCSATSKALGIYFLPVTLIGTFLPIIYYLYKYYRITGRNPRKEQKELQTLDETSPIKSYRSKVDWWLGGLLVFCLILPIWIAVVEFIDEGKFDMWMLVFELFMIVLLAPLFFIKYTLYDEHLKVQCGFYGTYRIKYASIINIKKTMNPLSSAAMSLKRIQIDYASGGMILISPKNRDEFIKIVNEKRGL
jgi:uncharacterized membrane protein